MHMGSVQTVNKLYLRGERTSTMNPNNRLTLSTSPQTQSSRKPRSLASLSLQRRSMYGRERRCHAGKELDSETGLYYYGARYLDPRTSRWLSGDPAVGEYIPQAPVNEEAKKRNGSLPGMGGVFNYANLHVYHYAGNNPVKYVDPDGNYLINNVARNTSSARNFASATSPVGIPINQIPRGFAHVFKSGTNMMVTVSPKGFENQYMPFNNGIEFDSILTGALDTALSNRNVSNITANAVDMKNGNFEIKVTVKINGQVRAASTVAFASSDEVLNKQGGIDRDKVKKIANDTINIVRNTVKSTNNIDGINQ